MPKIWVGETWFESEATTVGETVFENERDTDLEGYARTVADILGLFEMTRVLDGVTWTTDNVCNAELEPTNVHEG